MARAGRKTREERAARIERCISMHGLDYRRVAAAEGITERAARTWVELAREEVRRRHSTASLVCSIAIANTARRALVAGGFHA